MSCTTCSVSQILLQFSISPEFIYQRVEQQGQEVYIHFRKNGNLGNPALNRKPRSTPKPNYVQKERMNMSNRKRNIQILFCVTPEEKKLIRQKMILSKTRNMGAYLRKMAIDGYIINTDTAPIKQVYEEMHKIGVNINQIAKKVNITGDLYPEDEYSAVAEPPNLM